METIKRLKWAFLGIMIQIPVTIWIVSTDYRFVNFLIPVGSIFIVLLMLKIKETIIKKTERKEEFFYILINITVVFLAITQLMMLFKSIAIIQICVGGFLIIIGNIAPRQPVNKFDKILFPWAAKSEEIWKKTFKFGGFLTVFVGIIFILCGFLNIIFHRHIFGISVLFCLLGCGAPNYYRLSSQIKAV